MPTLVLFIELFVLQCLKKDWTQLTRSSKVRELCLDGDLGETESGHDSVPIFRVTKVILNFRSLIYKIWKMIPSSSNSFEKYSGITGCCLNGRLKVEFSLVGGTRTLQGQVQVSLCHIWSRSKKRILFCS